MILAEHVLFNDIFRFVPSGQRFPEQLQVRLRKAGLCRFVSRNKAPRVVETIGHNRLPAQRSGYITMLFDLLIGIRLIGYGLARYRNFLLDNRMIGTAKSE